MKLLERWRSISRDARAGYILAGAFALSFGTSVLVGPGLLVFAVIAILLVALTVAFVVLAIRLAIARGRRQRVMPLLVVSACLAGHWSAPAAATDLHLIVRVYLAGGPASISEWAQPMISEQAAKPGDALYLDEARLPPGIRTYLPGLASVGGTLWSDLSRLRIELGGGFYHYGIIVYPNDIAPPPEWWQSILDWPPEVVIYHET